MAKDIKSRRINMVITKDLSRLDRNLTDIAYYLGIDLFKIFELVGY